VRYVFFRGVVSTRKYLCGVSVALRFVAVTPEDIQENSASRKMPFQNSNGGKDDGFGRREPALEQSST